jgi:methylamine dehydrogenase accessory protein MauD
MAILVAGLILLAAAVFGLGFLLLGALVSIRRLNWRIDQLEAITPRRIGRDGLLLGGKAPQFSLADSAGNSISLADFRGQRVIVAFMQVGCGPCHEVLPLLNRLAARKSIGVLAIVHGTAEEVRAFADGTEARFPVAVQEDWEISKRFQVFATPFAFVLDEEAVVLAKGIISTGEYLQLLLSDAERRQREGASSPRAAEPAGGRATVAEA